MENDNYWHEEAFENLQELVKKTKRNRTLVPLFLSFVFGVVFRFLNLQFEPTHMIALVFWGMIIATYMEVMTVKILLFKAEMRQHLRALERPKEDGF